MIEWINGVLSQLATSITVANPGTLAAIFLLTVSADIGIPLPFVLDSIMFFTAYKMGPISWPVLIIVILLFSGRMLGTGVIYWISRLLGAKFTDWMARRSKFLVRNLARLQSRLGRWSIPVIAAARLTPGLMQVSSVAAGSLRISYYRLVVAIVLSSIVYDGTLIAMGTLARLGLKNIKPEDSAWVLIGFVALMLAVYVVIHLIRQRFK